MKNENCISEFDIKFDWYLSQLKELSPFYDSKMITHIIIEEFIKSTDPDSQREAMDTIIYRIETELERIEN
jgi:hypothetical protein